jgi:hypothetical protein
MNRRHFLGLAAGAGAALGAIDCGPPYRYLRQSFPSSLLGAQRVALEPVHFEGLRVGDLPEAVYLASKTPQQQASFEADKQEFANRFLAWMAQRSPVPIIVGPPPDPGTLILRPIMVHYEPGFFAYVVNRGTEVDMNLQVVRADGATLEEIALRAVVQASMVNAASGTRMRLAGEQMGDFVAEYLQHRVRGVVFAPRARRSA